MLLIDLTHTSHTHARTGIQRVARALHQHLGPTATPITRDPFVGAWRALELWELANLASSRGGHKRKAQWPATAKWRGRLRRALGRTARHALPRHDYAGLIVPELFGAPVARDFPKLFQHVRGPRVALFLDAIPLRFPEFTPPATVARFPGYLQELLMFDGIAAISEESRDSLTAYWGWLGRSSSNTPPVTTLPLGVDFEVCHLIDDKPPAPSRPIVLCVGTLEGRKNHLALLDACEQLWSQNTDFELRIIGHVNAETGGAALTRLRALQAAGRPLRFDGPATDETIANAYATCAFTVYPSIAEGFGLPVIESLARGKPCICSGRGALGEISQHGGCVALDSLDATTLARSIARLLAQPAELAALSAAARQRTFKSWADYARQLTAWMQSLPPRR
jgi:glycosyltransferase involved in cell wall biosynthesis